MVATSQSEPAVIDQATHSGRRLRLPDWRRWSRRKRALAVAIVAFGLACLLYLWLPYRVAVVQLVFWLGGSRVMIPMEYASLDSPEYQPLSQSDDYPPDAEVLGLELGGQVKAIPVKRLAWRLVLNDVLAGEPIVVTLCTVTDAAIAYRAGVDNRTLHFTPARIARNNLVLRDRQTGTNWQQFTGQAIDGPLAGACLERIPLWRGPLSLWRQRHPKAEILKAIGHDHDCCAPNDTCPVMSFFPTEPFLLQSPTHEDARLARKERVLALDVGGQPVAVCRDSPVGPDDAGPGLRIWCYWFAWIEFHPNTELATQWDSATADRFRQDYFDSPKEPKP